MVTGIISADQRPTLETGPSLRNRGDRAYHHKKKVQINHNRFLGYTKDADGNLIIDPEQAEIVKRIYREYLEGLSMDKIAAGLERDGILTGAGGKKWHTSTINKILRNEKYIGDALLQKTYTTDFLNKTRVKNNGLVPQYYVEDDHEAIIPKDIYLQGQEELVRCWIKQITIWDDRITVELKSGVSIDADT